MSLSRISSSSHHPWIRRQLGLLRSSFAVIPIVSYSISCKHSLGLSTNALGGSPAFATSAALPSSIPPPLSGDVVKIGLPMKGSKVILKGMRYEQLEKWVQSHGFRPAQALMLWKLLYGNNIWACCIEELEGLNKDFKRMLSEHAEFKVLNLKDMLTASDGTKKEITDIIHTRRWTGN